MNWTNSLDEYFIRKELYLKGEINRVNMLDKVVECKQGWPNQSQDIRLGYGFAKAGSLRRSLDFMADWGDEVFNNYDETTDVIEKSKMTVRINIIT